MISVGELRVARERALCVGGRDLDPDEERAALPIELVATAISGLAELTAAALVGIELAGRGLPPDAIDTARREADLAACRALRLCQRALEADARDTGYDSQPWSDAALRDAAFQLGEAAGRKDAEGATLRQADGLARALGEAARALSHDRMALPEALSIAQAHALLLVLAAEG